LSAVGSGVTEPSATEKNPPDTDTVGCVSVQSNVPPVAASYRRKVIACEPVTALPDEVRVPW